MQKVFLVRSAFCQLCVLALRIRLLPWTLRAVSGVQMFLAVSHTNRVRQAELCLDFVYEILSGKGIRMVIPQL